MQKVAPLAELTGYARYGFYSDFFPIGDAEAFALVVSLLFCIALKRYFEKCSTFLLSI